MALKQGTIKSVKPTKTFNTKYGEKKHTIIKLDDGHFYTVQFEDADSNRFQEGQQVEFKFTEEESRNKDQNGDPYINYIVDKKTLEVEDGPSNPAPSGNSSSSGNTKQPTAGASGNTVDDKQMQIMRQSTLGYATTMLAGTLTSKSDVNVAAQKAMEIADSLFMEYVTTGKIPSLQGEEEEQEEEEIQKQQQIVDEKEAEDEDPF